MPESLIQHIIVTTDLSADAAKAFGYAQYLARQCGATITLVTCIDTSLHLGAPGFLDEPSMYIPEALQAIRERTQTEITKQASMYFPDTMHKTTVRESPRPTHRILVDFINQTPAELVIMSSHGRTGISRAFLGSVAEQVIRHSIVPVLVVPVGSERESGV
jgi:nucleotide-binding universal stress UspA family protein